jgi:hypothetical protein
MINDEPQPSSAFVYHSSLNISKGDRMSARNGDKSRHAITKRRVRAQRARIRQLMKSKTQQSGEAKAAK